MNTEGLTLGDIFNTAGLEMKISDDQIYIQPIAPSVNSLAHALKDFDNLFKQSRLSQYLSFEFALQDQKAVSRLENIGHDLFNDMAPLGNSGCHEIFIRMRNFCFRRNLPIEKFVPYEYTQRDTLDKLIPMFENAFSEMEKEFPNFNKKEAEEYLKGHTHLTLTVPDAISYYRDSLGDESLASILHLNADEYTDFCNGLIRSDRQFATVVLKALVEIKQPSDSLFTQIEWLQLKNKGETFAVINHGDKDYLSPLDLIQYNTHGVWIVRKYLLGLSEGY